MTILVTGASGFLGKKLTHFLLDHQYDVVAIARSERPTRLKQYANLQWIRIDLENEYLDRTCLPNIETVVHLAGATLGAGKDENKFLCANEKTLVRLLQSLADVVQHFIFASSQVVYGNACHLNVTEDFPLCTQGSAYACSKVNAENWFQWFQKKNGGRYLALRFCGFIDGGGIIDYIIDKALRSETIELFAHGSVCRDYLSSEDAVNVLISALNYKGDYKFMPVNIGSGQVMSAFELTTLICSELKSMSPINILSDPAPQGDFVFSIERAKKLFNFKPGNLPDMIRKYARDYVLSHHQK